MIAESNWARASTNRPVRKDESILVPEAEVLPWEVVTSERLALTLGREGGHG